MRSYVTYFKLQIINALQYRSAALSGILAQFFWGTLLIFVFQSFYTSGNQNQIISFSQMVPYVWINQAFFAMLYLMADDDIIESFKSGNVCYELTKPYKLYWFWFIRLLAKKYAATSLRFLPIIVVAIFLPAPYNLTLPISFFAFILFIISLFLGSIMIGVIVMLVTMLSFYNNTGDGITDIIFIVIKLLSGSHLPLPFLPEIIKNLTYYLPFRLIADLPLRVYTGNMLINEALFSLVLQIAWIAVIMFIGTTFLKIIVKRIYVQGG